MSYVLQDINSWVLQNQHKIFTPYHILFICSSTELYIYCTITYMLCNSFIMAFTRFDTEALLTEVNWILIKKLAIISFISCTSDKENTWFLHTYCRILLLLFDAWFSIVFRNMYHYCSGKIFFRNRNIPALNIHKWMSTAKQQKQYTNCKARRLEKQKTQQTTNND